MVLSRARRRDPDRHADGPRADAARHASRGPATQIASAQEPGETLSRPTAQHADARSRACVALTSAPLIALSARAEPAAR